MDDTETKRRLRRGLVEVLELQRDPEQLPDANLIAELGIDSIQSLEYLLWVEGEFDVQIADADLSADLVDSLDRLSHYLRSRPDDAAARSSGAMDEALRELEDEAVHTLREVVEDHPRTALLWSMGKDSTTLLWLLRKAFMGEVPCPVVHIDTSFKFTSMYEFRERITREWGLNLIVHRNEEALAAGMGPHGRQRLECCTALKTEALRQVVAVRGFDALIVGIRGDEHAVRAKERTVSPRRVDFAWRYQDQPPEFWDLTQTRSHDVDHYRVHPLLRWTESDIWDYVRDQAIPLPDLYFARNGQRYRSIGCQTCTLPVESDADTVELITVELRTSKAGERAGRAQDKEDVSAMQKLRALGYL